MKNIKDILRQIPILVTLYRQIKYLFHRYFLKFQFRNHTINKLSFLSSLFYSPQENSFFGYYNITPANNKGDVVFCSVKTNEDRGSLYEPVKICIKSDNKVNVIAESKAWNWQQGCMLQWLGGSDEVIIYNDYFPDGDNYVSKILNIKTGGLKTICKPVYAVSKAGDFALTLNFDRLALMRPDYGYFNRKICLNDLPNYLQDGIWYVDLMKNVCKLIISLEQLIAYKPSNTMKDAEHKVNHIDIAPDGNRFVFLHRWIGPQGRFMRLLTANCIDGSNLYYLTGDIMVSHNCWWTKQDIISFCRMSDGRNRYVHFKDLNGFVEVIGGTDFHNDGHPSVSLDGRWMLTDEYPNSTRFSNLFLYDLINGNKILLGKFFQPLKFNDEKRIDLHPKWIPDGKQVFFESGHTGKRQLYQMNVSQIVNE
ncbi:MAG TPA: hypothetical protein PKW17_12570 [Smithellaceae bacterium]|nr:hypothetical protein [Smithellaceae bacterium]